MKGQPSNCYGGGLNGVYAYEGDTADGKRYYSHTTGSVYQSLGYPVAYLFFDRDDDNGKEPGACGAGAEDNNEWYIDNSKPSTTAAQDLDGDNDCLGFAVSRQPDTSGSLTPPARAEWVVGCGGGGIAMTLSFQPICATTAPDWTYTYPAEWTDVNAGCGTGIARQRTAAEACPARGGCDCQNKRATLPIEKEMQKACTTTTTAPTTTTTAKGDDDGSDAGDGNSTAAATPFPSPPSSPPTPNNTSTGSPLQTPDQSLTPGTNESKISPGLGAGIAAIVSLIVAAIVGLALYCRNRKAAAGHAHGVGNIEEIELAEQRRNTLAMADNPMVAAMRAHAAKKRQPAAAITTVDNPGFIGITFAGNRSTAHNKQQQQQQQHGGDDDDALDYVQRLEEVEPTTQRYQGKLRVPLDFVPEQDCRMSLLLAGDTLGVPDLAGMVEDVATRLEEDGIPPTHPEYNSRFALYMYTFHANHLPSLKQFYAVLNAGLRSRQEGWFQLWMPFIYYLTRALRELPDVATVVYKGMQMPANVDKYNGKKKIHWSGFSSTTTSEAVAQKFAGIGGLVLKMDVLNGKNVQPFSWFGHEESELVLSPNMEFIVEGFPKALKKPYEYAGRTYIDLAQLPNETLYS